MTRFYALLILLVLIGAAVVWFVSQMGGSSYWETLKESWEFLRLIVFWLIVIGVFGYVIDVVITGSWAG